MFADYILDFIPHFSMKNQFVFTRIRSFYRQMRYWKRNVGIMVKKLIEDIEKNLDEKVAELDEVIFRWLKELVNLAEKVWDYELAERISNQSNIAVHVF